MTRKRTTKTQGAGRATGKRTGSHPVADGASGGTGKDHSARVSPEEIAVSRTRAAAAMAAWAAEVGALDLQALTEPLREAIGPIQVRMSELAATLPDLRPSLVTAESLIASFEIARLLEVAGQRPDRKATSLRLNRSLWEAAELAVQKGWAPSLTTLVEESVSTRLAGLASIAAEQAALDEHYERHPHARSDLWELARAAAEIDGNPIAEHPDLLRRAADSLGDRADIDAVLAWAEGALTASAR